MWLNRWGWGGGSFRDTQTHTKLGLFLVWKVGHEIDFIRTTWQFFCFFFLILNLIYINTRIELVLCQTNNIVFH